MVNKNDGKDMRRNQPKQSGQQEPMSGSHRRLPGIGSMHYYQQRHLKLQLGQIGQRQQMQMAATD